MSFQVLVTENYSAEALQKLRSLGADKNLEILVDTEFKKNEAALKSCQALLIRSRTEVNLELLEAAPNLKVVISATSGFDHIDLKACKKKSIQVAHTPEANADSTAELTLALMLNLSRHIHHSSKAISTGHWREASTRGHQLKGRCLGIVGFGRVGKKVAKLAQAFGMKVIAADPYLTPEDMIKEDVEALSFSELLLAADIVSFHVPLTTETKHMINHQTIRHMNSEALLINVSRGEVLSETDLTAALDEGILSGLALDVFEKEPLPRSSRLRSYPQILMTPHIGAYTEEAFSRSSFEAVENLLHFLKSGSVLTPLPEHQAWFAKSL